MCRLDETKISVVIPVHNGGMNFRKCLSSLAKAKPPPHELVVVVDGSKDDSSSIAREFKTLVLEVPKSGGPARARNLGAGMAEGDILFFLDADVTVTPDVLNQVSSAFTSDPSLAAVIGSYDDEPRASNFLSQFKNLFHHYIHQRADEKASTFWGACGAIRKKTFLSLGGFEESYKKPSIEDIELGYRLKKEGHSIRLIKSLQVKHLKRWGLFSLLKSDIFQRALPWTKLILHSRMFVNDLNTGIFDRISVILVYGLIGALAGSLIWLWLLLLAGGLLVSIIFLNMELYRFFTRKRGCWFALRSLAWHLFYYFYCGLTFAAGLIAYVLKKLFIPGKITQETQNHRA